MLQKSSRQKLVKFIQTFVISVFLVAGIFTLLYYSDNYFKVKKIEILGEINSSDLRGIESWNGKNMFLIQEDKMKQDLINANPLLKDVKVVKKYPNTLNFIVSRYEESVYLVVDQGYFLLGDDGRILSKTKDKAKDLPVINYYQKLNYSSWQSGDFIQYKDIMTALHFLRKSSDLGLTINTIDIGGTNMIALQLKDRKILFSSEKDRVLEDYQLDTIIRQFKIEGRQFTVLDLRFDKPVIQFN